MAEIEKTLKRGLLPLAERKSVADARVLGAIGVLEMREPIDVPAVQEKLVARGVWLRPFGRLLYTMPPYVASDSQLEAIVGAMSEVAE